MTKIVNGVQIVGDELDKWRKSMLDTACDIEDWSKIPKSTVFAHPLGVTIGFGVKLGERCIIRSGVVLGEAHRGKQDYPTIGNDVDIGANCVVMGDITIGDNVIIGAGSIVNKSIPPNSIVYSKNELVVKPR